MLHKPFSPRRLAAAQCLIWALAAAPAGACGYHGLIGDSFSASYPGSIDVAIALRTALDRNQLKTAPAVPPLMALVRSTRWLEDFGRWAGQHAATAPDFAVLLVEPGLWTRYRKQGSGFAMESHVATPSTGDVVLITGEPALQALVERRLSLADALKTGVVRIEGAPEAVTRLQQTLTAAFSAEPSRAVTASR
jgi:hypothetical protein